MAKSLSRLLEQVPPWIHTAEPVSGSPNPGAEGASVLDDGLIISNVRGFNNKTVAHVWGQLQLLCDILYISLTDEGNIKEDSLSISGEQSFNGTTYTNLLSVINSITELYNYVQTIQRSPVIVTDDYQMLSNDIIFVESTEHVVILTLPDNPINGTRNIIFNKGEPVNDIVIKQLLDNNEDLVIDIGNMMTTLSFYNGEWSYVMNASTTSITVNTNPHSTGTTLPDMIPDQDPYLTVGFDFVNANNVINCLIGKCRGRTISHCIINITEVFDGEFTLTVGDNENNSRIAEASDSFPNYIGSYEIRPDYDYNELVELYAYFNVVIPPTKGLGNIMLYIK
jgi:hypothetical protein